MPPENPFLPSTDNLDITFSHCRTHGCYRDLQFEDCLFEHCDFAKARFESLAFVDCRFIDCDLTMIDIPDSTFNGVVFERCRLRGVDWTKVSSGLLSLEFHECVLDYGNFEDMKLKKTPFVKCSVVESTFDRAELRESDFSGSKLTKATFANADLSRSDFRDTEGLALDLSACKCSELKLRLADARGTLQMHGIRVSP